MFPLFLQWLSTSPSIFHLRNSIQKPSEFKMSSYQTPLGWHTEFLEGLLGSSQVPVLRQEPVGGGGGGGGREE